MKIWNCILFGFQMVRDLGPLEWIFNTPKHHRVHHGETSFVLVHVNPSTTGHFDSTQLKGKTDHGMKRESPLRELDFNSYGHLTLHYLNREEPLLHRQELRRNSDHMGPIIRWAKCFCSWWCVFISSLSLECDDVLYMQLIREFELVEVKTELNWSFSLVLCRPFCSCRSQVHLLQRQTKWFTAWCSPSNPSKSSVCRWVLSPISGAATISQPLASLRPSINSSSRWGVSLCFSCRLSGCFSNHNIITLLQTNCPVAVSEAIKTKCQEEDVMIVFAVPCVGRAQGEPWPPRWQQEHFCSRYVGKATVW